MGNRRSRLTHAALLDVLEGCIRAVALILATGLKAVCTRLGLVPKERAEVRRRLKIGHSLKELLARYRALEYGQRHFLGPSIGRVQTGRRHEQRPLIVVDEVFVAMPGALKESYVQNIQSERDCTLLCISHGVTLLGWKPLN